MAETLMSYLDIMEGLRRRFDEIKDVFPVFEDVRSKHCVEKARSCVLIGCGNGEMELAFIEHCMPALQQLAAVEPDAESVVDLRQRLSRQLPNVRCSVFQGIAQDWITSTDQVVDVAIMFHCISDIPESERRQLVDGLYKSVIRPNGLLVVTTRTERPDGTQSAESRIMQALNPRRPYRDSKWYSDARHLLESVGFSVCFERCYGLNVNVQNLDEAYFSFYARECDEPTSLAKVEQVVRDVIGDTKCTRKEMCFGVFRKP